MTSQLPSKERLEKIASWRVTYGAGHNVMLPAEEAEAMARALLAAHEQEPVAVIDKDGNPMTREECNDDRIFTICCKVGTPLYTHPAPVPAVPDAIKWPAEKFCPAEYAGSLLWNETEIWNKAVETCQDAYRAAMLNHPSNNQASAAAAVGEEIKQPSSNNGWIPVSERLPDETQPVIVVSDGGVVQRTVYQFCEGVWTDWYEQYDEVATDAFTYWMPLPPAPKVTP